MMAGVRRMFAAAALVLGLLGCAGAPTVRPDPDPDPGPDPRRRRRTGCSDRTAGGRAVCESVSRLYPAPGA